MSDKITKEALAEHYIACPRFGGQRVALNCVHLDRYRTCRRWCKSLSAQFKKFPDLLEIVKKYCDGREQSYYLKTKFSGKGIPNPELVCPICRFVAKSGRGLKIHNNRQHRYVGTLWE